MAAKSNIVDVQLISKYASSKKGYNSKTQKPKNKQKSKASLLI